MSVYEIILKRRTIRRFKQEPLSLELLEKLVNAGRLAPSGANLQPLEFIIVDDPEMVNKVFPALKWAGYIAPAGNPPEGKRPVAYIVVLVNTQIKSGNGSVDAAAAIENMILTALEENVGSCWLGSIDRNQLRSVFDIPQHYQIDSVVALGYPDESPVVEEVKDSIKYWKDDQGVLHVPKRRLSDIVHYNRF
ncbi:MAG: nitroreductase family protein [candidate division KSB1 bacterium]|nr:nitroreductase family protein [candidate division KSB1 bacterium]MDZ7335892.1 nitroreductase family protein [candidate division KSB1 bacterium]MDZ7356688.1 nitroreductase family protein [candidate division KSB1 bacterium]MDZ7398565.1 nitroreductase family protein [candidate division KSB1 bacterium]